MIRIGIVGCGRILAAHLHGYRLLREAGVDDFRITALCARNPSDAQMYIRRGEGPTQRLPVSNLPGDPLALGDIYLSDFQPETPVEVFTDYRTMIELGPLDAVNDFTTHVLHHQIAAFAFAHGKDLLTQKPLAATVAAGRQMCEGAARSDCVFGVFENARYRPITRQLRWLFNSGQFGQLQMILLNNVGNWWAPDRVVAGTPWRHSRLEAGGITLDIGVHLMHQFRYLAGEIRNVQGTAATLEPVRYVRDREESVLQTVDCDADDTMLAGFATESGVLGQLSASWAGRGQALVAPPGRGVIYYGSAGCVVGDQVQPTMGEPRSLEALYRESCDADEQTRHFPYGLTNDFALNQLDWLSAVRERRQPETSGGQGLHDLAAAYAVLESHAAGRRVDFSEVLRGELRTAQRELDERLGLD